VPKAFGTATLDETETEEVEDGREEVGEVMVVVDLEEDDVEECL
jgi:hypothetical protein